MPSFSSLNTAITGMRAAQMGLAVTAHNMANAEINGFSRQRSIQTDHRSRIIGTNAAGHRLIVGTGADNQAVEHIRSRYFDIIYRQHNARLHFHSVIAAAGEHIETILGETETTFKLSDLLRDMLDSLHELSVGLDAIEARELFIATSIGFLDKAHSIFEGLFAFQQNLDGQIRNMVTEINDIVARIDQLNRDIRGHEISGDNANDLRDERHRLMDRLSGLIPTDFFENERGDVDILTTNGNFLLHQGSVNPLGLKFISGRYSFVEPVFTHSRQILESDTPPWAYQPLFNWNRPLNAANGNDEGALMALLRARGAMPATYRGMDAIWEPARPYARPPVDPAGPNAIWFANLLPDINDLLDIPAIGAAPASPPDFINFETEFEAYIDAWNNFLTAGGGLPFFTHGVPGITSGFPGAFPYHGPIPPNPADFIIEYDDEDTWPAIWGGYWLGDPSAASAPGTTIPGIENPNFAGAWRRYVMERENDFNQFQLLYPLSFTDSAAFDAAVAAGAGDPDFNRLMDTYNAARRTYRQAEWSKQHAMVPRVMMEIDQIVNSVVRLINDSLAPITNYVRDPNAPFDLYRERSYTPVFVRRLPGDRNYIPRFDSTGPFAIHNPGMPGAFNTLYTTRNLMINPALLDSGGYNLLALHLSADRQDTTLIQEMIRQWGASDGDFSITIRGNNFSIRDAYRMSIEGLAIETSEAVNHMGSSFQRVSQADNRRNAISGVSMDEELSSMMTFQFAYQAAARLFNIVDSMIDTVINRMLR